MNKAVFLDRDGVINKETGQYTTCVEDFIINEGIGESIKLLKDSGFLVIIISNQGGIAKSLYSHEDVLEMHLKLCEYLYIYNTAIDDFYYCPHHPDIGLCLCRKPDSLLLEKAISRYNISIEDSYFIGDSERDMDAAIQMKIYIISVKIFATRIIASKNI
jgi:D-glycero-D-manno-heptose 1,7-bisphosphate phosphatase